MHGLPSLGNCNEIAVSPPAINSYQRGMLCGAIPTSKSCTYPLPDQLGGELIVIPRSLGTILQVLSQKPTYMLALPGPGVIELPSLLDSRLHDSGLP